MMIEQQQSLQKKEMLLNFNFFLYFQSYVMFWIILMEKNMKIIFPTKIRKLPLVATSSAHLNT